MELHREHLGPEHPQTLQAVASLATVHRDQGRHAEAKAGYEQVARRPAPRLLSEDSRAAKSDECVRLDAGLGRGSEVSRPAPGDRAGERGGTELRRKSGKSGRPSAWLIIGPASGRMRLPPSRSPRSSPRADSPLSTASSWRWLTGNSERGTRPAISSRKPGNPWREPINSSNRKSYASDRRRRRCWAVPDSK